MNPEEANMNTNLVQDQDLVTKLRKMPCLGLFLAWVSAISIASANFTVTLMQEVDVTFLVITRCFIHFMVFVPFVVKQGHSIMGAKGERLVMLERCLFGFICFVANYYAFDYISFSDSQSIVFAAPALVSIFGCLLLKESFGIIHGMTLLTTFTGVVLISRPESIFGSTGHEDIFSSQDRIIGIVLSLLTCVTLAYTYISMRKLQSTSTCSQVCLIDK